ncbi:MAG: IS66 family transposase [Alphaproteobacteria bacterium]
MTPRSVQDLRDRLEALERELGSVRAENERLRRALEEALRQSKRQAAPHSRNNPKPDPKPSGRKSGSQYGAHARRRAPDRVDEQIRVPLPATCECCGGRVVHTDSRPQFQEDIVRLTVVRRFDVEIGRCAACGRRVQGRHPLQTSDALGAAQVQLGPEAVAVAAQLTKGRGLSHGAVADVLHHGYGLQVSRSGLCRAILRLGEKAAPTYEGLVQAVRTAPVAWLDETGWRVAAHLHWLWVAVTEDVTVFAIQAGRGFPEAAALLGEDYDGFLHHDGWRPYYGFPQAFHQTCLAHLLRRCRDLIAIASPAAACFPRAVRAHFQQALALRDRYAAGTISRHGLAVATGRLDAAMDRLLARSVRTPANRRLAQHLDHERPYLFSFLHCPGLDATNNVAERALRPAVCARKTWGGNRTSVGARAQQILASVLRTCWQQRKDAFPRLVGLLRSPVAQCLDLVPAAHSP